MFIFKRSTKIISLFFLMLFVSSTGLLIVQADSGSVSYSGHVYNLGGTPLSGATVRLYINDDMVPVFRETTTSGTGYYTVTTPYGYATPPVDIALLVSKTGYVSDSYGATVYDGSYTHDFYLELDVPPTPSVGWVSPPNNQLITFPQANNDFSFTYSAENIDYTRLFIGLAGPSPTTQFGSDWTDEGTSISKTVDIGSYMGSLQGLVRADLRGYVSSSVVVEATRTFNFSKVVSVETELLEDGRTELGSNLMLILYDPPGDQSYSTWTSETKVRIKNSISFEVGVEIEGQIGVELFDSGASTKTTVDLSGGPDFAWENVFTDIEELTSSLNTAERDLVGPGYGDLYYGEYEIFVWEIYATKTTYADSTIVYSDPYIYYGIEYSDHALVSRENAPSSWLQQNPNINTALYDDTNTVQWIEDSSILEGGTGAREVTHEESNSFEWGINFEFTISHETRAKICGTGTAITGHFTFKYDHDDEITNSIKTVFHIQDDDSADYFRYDVGIDKRFGVPIFRNTPNANPILISESSSPWEHNTRDVIAPVTTYPVITLNTDFDDYSPSEADTPLVELTITDESNISVASLIYSYDNGDNWNTISMAERLNDPNSWYANIPGFEHGTVVLWYIFTTDNNDNSKTVLDVDLDYFSYTIVNRPCTVELTTPNGGEVYEESILIEWAGSDPDDDSLTYNIGYRIGGGSWTLIATELTDTSYLWDISGFADSDTVSIIVYAYDGSGGTDNDESDFVFGIDNVDIPDASILTPLTSFSYEGIVTITWSVTDPDDYITGYELYYSVVSGTPSWVLMEGGVAANVFTYEWNTTAIVHSTNVRIKIVVQNSLAETVETSTGIFTLDNRPALQMNLINPNGGEIFTTSCQITWNLVYTNQLIIYQIKLEYSYNSSSWIEITSGITGTSYNWNTTDLQAGTNYRLRITLTATYLGYALDPIVDISESTFMIIKQTPTGINSVPLIVTVIALASLTIIPVLKLRKRN